MEIIEQTSDFAARTTPTLDDPTNIDLDIIVKISDYNPDALRRIDLDVYIIELRENRREPTPSEKDDICSICCEEFGTEGDINSLNCKHSYHHRCILDWIYNAQHSNQTMIQSNEKDLHGVFFPAKSGNFFLMNLSTTSDLQKT
ncbi:hypothetical protein YC2023_008139 [Brassica napus]